MAFNPKKYPPYWKQFSKWVRFERAGNYCETCGIRNGSVKISLREPKNAVLIVEPDKQEEFLATENWLADVPHKISKVVLTVAHLDHAEGVCRCRKNFGFKCAKPSHVLALCQACHLALDRPKHVAVRRKNLTRKKDKARLLFEKLER